MRYSSWRVTVLPWISVAIVILGCGRVNFANSPDSGASEMFTRRNQLVVRGTMLAESVVGFPLFVQLRAAEVDLGAAAPDGADLRFYAGDDTTELPYEIEQDSAAGFDLWVRVPQIAGGTDETLWVYYGNPAAPAGEQREAVWSTDYSAVWHLGDGRDSTQHQLDGTLNGTRSEIGIAGLGRDMELGWVEVADAPALAAIGANGVATWSAWARPVTLPSTTSALIDRQHETSALDDFRFGPSTDGTINGQVNLDPGQVNLPFGGGSYMVGEWNLFAMVRDGDELRAGVNGVTQERITGVGTIHASANPVWLGAGCNGCAGTPNGDLMDGMLDEARIESVARSDGWLRAEYLNLTAPLVVVQPFEIR